MSARPFASGTISFGLVTIPVKLYSTGESAAGIQFNMLHKKCGTRLKQQYVCPTDNEVIGREDVVKGYEYSKGQYVLFTDDELKALNPEATNGIEIAEFVPLDQVDPVYYEKSYYLGPDKGGDRPYRLLSEAMRKTGRAALARYAARGKDQLVLLRPFDGGLIMQQSTENKTLSREWQEFGRRLQLNEVGVVTRIAAILAKAREAADE